MKYQLKQYIEGLKQTWKKRFGKNDVVLNPVVVEKDGFFEIVSKTLHKYDNV